MPKSTDWATDLNLLLFNNDAAPLIGDAAGLQPSAADGVFWVALHTASPGVGGKQNVSECAYPGYARVSVARTPAGWTVVGAAVSNTAVIPFGQCGTGGGPEVATHASIGVASSGATKVIRFAALLQTLTISQGIIPRIEAGDFDLTEA